MAYDELEKPCTKFFDMLILRAFQAYSHSFLSLTRYLTVFHVDAAICFNREIVRCLPFLIQYRDLHMISTSPCSGAAAAMRINREFTRSFLYCFEYDLLNQSQNQPVGNLKTHFLYVQCIIM